MTIITTYSTLVQNIQAVTEDDGAEFLAYIPTAIALAEERLIRDCDFPELELSAGGTIPIGQSTFTRPTGYKVPVHLYLTANNRRLFLRRRTEQYLIDYWPDPSLTGVPKYYSAEDTVNITVVPTADNTYGYTLKYLGEPARLSTGNETNYYTDNCPDLLFNSTMAEIAKFMKAWSQVASWEATYQEGRASWNWEQARKRRDTGSNPQNPEGGTNSLKNNVETGSRA